MKRFRIFQTQPDCFVVQERGWFIWNAARYHRVWAENFPVTWSTLDQAKKHLDLIVQEESFVPKSHKDVTV